MTTGDGSSEVARAGSSPSWQKVEAAFAELLELPENEKQPAVEHLLTSDPDLGREVASLIEADQAPDDAVAEAVSEALERSLVEPAPPLKIGPYRPIREIGRGGMGVVFLAEEEGDTYRRQVAVKLLKRGLETAELLRRLRQERQILARLEHAAIPRLLGGGSTETGQPYLAMDFIDGEPIDIYCDRHRLGIAHRLRLFARICDAVQYAHGLLIVHRDIKPANILVTIDGQPKLLDFGIAKILEASPWPFSRAETSHGARLLTPDFASPEQRAGEPPTTATDIYSLGLVLHVLLTGNLPTADFAPGSASLRLEDDRIAAHRGTTLPRLRRLLKGDLDTLLAKAMHTEASRRYVSVQQLADDVRRHLENRPILARPESWLYQASKLVRRHRALTTATLLVIFSLAAGLVGTTWQAQLARHQQARAEHFLTMLVEASSAADPWTKPGESVPIDLVFDDWTLKLETWMQSFPADRAKVLETIGRVRLHQGRHTEAEQSLLEALEELGRTDSQDPSVETNVLNALVELRFDQGRLQEAERLARRVLLSVQRNGQPGSELAEGLNDLAAILEARGQLDEASKLYSQALEVRQQLFGEDHPATANSLGNLGALAFHRGDLSQAEQALRQAVSRLEKAHGVAHPRVTEHRVNLASVLRQLGQTQEARSLLSSALQQQIDVLGADHPQVARGRAALASILTESGELESAEQLLRAALGGHESTDAPGPLVAELAVPLADIRYRRGDPQEAELLYRRAVEIRRRQQAPPPAELRRSLGRLGDLLRHLGREKEAAPLYLELLSIEDEPAAGTRVDRARWLLALGRSLAATGDLEGAEAAAIESLCLRQHQGRGTKSAQRLLASLPQVGTPPTETQR